MLCRACRQYLERNNITDVTRDHFTFSSKVVIGDYLKVSPAPGTVRCGSGNSFTAVEWDCQTTEK